MLTKDLNFIVAANQKIAISAFIVAGREELGMRRLRLVPLGLLEDGTTMSNMVQVIQR